MNQKTILVAEDDVLLRGALTEKLTHEGFCVHGVSNGKECLKKALESHPDLILLDVLMPRMGGIAVLKKLREDEWGAHAKVILLTNLTDTEKLTGKRSYRADGYLIKADTRIGEVITKIREELDISQLACFPPNTEFAELPEYRCTCGKLLFKGALLFSTVEVKCKRCRAVKRIDTSGQKTIG